MVAIDQIPWSTLHHAYGTAEDVPGLLRQLRSVETSDTALDELFGNIWHQGTVYEATSFAVPFLVDLVMDQRVPNRVGILNLLAAISRGTSYLDVHEAAFKNLNVDTFGEPGSLKFESRRSQELDWVAKARSAIVGSFVSLLELVNRVDDIAYAALAVLVCTNTRQQEVQSVISRFLLEETRDLYRGGLLILLGQLGCSDENLWRQLNASSNSGSLERLAAGLTACRFQKNEISGSLRTAVVEAMCTFEVAWMFAKLPWDVVETIHSELLFQRPNSETKEAITILFQRIDRREAIKESIYLLLDLLFSRLPQEGRFTDKNQLSENQLRLLKVLLKQYEAPGFRLCVALSSYGLPDSRRSLRSLVFGEIYEQLDELYPEIAYAENPLRPRWIRRLKSGDRIHSRFFGLGTVKEVEFEGRFASIQIEFDEEGWTEVSYNHSIICYLIDLGSYWLIKLFGKRSN